MAQRLGVRLALALGAVTVVDAVPVGAGLTAVSAEPSATKHRSVSVVRLGGTQGFTGKPFDASRARSAYRGLLVLQDVVNTTEPFRSPDGESLVLDLLIEDDKNDPHEASDKYLGMTFLEEPVDFFLGPSDPRIATGTAFQFGKEHLIMMIGATPPEVYKERPLVFSVDVMPTYYMTAGLDTMRKADARTLAITVGNEDPLSINMCDGAKEHARRIGFEIIGNFFSENMEITQQIRKLQALAPDAFVHCGSRHEAIETVVTARALGYSAKGMLISNAIGEDFVHAVGASNANYILAPTTWSPSLPEHNCKVFGSPQGFAAKYRKMWNEEPNQYSAQAAAGALALLAAVEEAGSKDTAEVREALLRLNFSTFYKRLVFTANGTLQDESVLVEQTKPETFSKSYSAVVGPAFQGVSKLLWPMPDWELKDVEVYPCSVGQQWEPTPCGDGCDNVEGQCVICPRGKFRGPHITSCKSCEVKTYGDRAGMDSCTPCPSGANCSETGLDRRPNATKGSYELDQAEDLQIVQCEPPSLCVGNNQCSGQNTGFLCKACQPGYTTNTGFGVKNELCQKCPSPVQNILMLAIVVLVYAFLMSVLVKVTRAGSTSIRAIHSVILKIGVNYLQFAGTAFEATHFSEMLRQLGGPATHFTVFAAMPQALQFPFNYIISEDCVVIFTGFKKYQVYVLLGLLIMPTCFALKFSYSFCRKVIQKIIEAACDDDSDIEAAMDNRVPAFVRHAPSGLSPTTGGGEHGGTPTPSRFQGQMSPVTPRTPKLERAQSFHKQIPAAINRIKTKVDLRGTASDQSRKFVQSSIVMGFVLHPLVVELLLVSFRCVQYGTDRLRLMGELDVICTSDEHLLWILLSTLGLVTYGLGLPALLFTLLYRGKSRLLQPDMVNSYGFLYNGFEIRYYYFESFYMLRKVVILLMAAAPTMYIRMIGMVTASWGFVLLHLHTEPFDNRSYHCLDMLETLNLLALTVTLMSRLIFDMRSEASGSSFSSLARSPVVSFGLIAVPLTCHAYFAGFAAWCLFRNSVLKYLVLKAELWPDRITHFQKLCIALDMKTSKLAFDGKRHSISIVGLGQKERRFLIKALGETLSRYVDSGKEVTEVRPGLVTTAVQKAFERCATMRAKRRQDMLELELKHEGTSWWSSIRKWKGELSLSLQGLNKRGQEPMTEEEFFRRSSMSSNMFSVEELHEALMLIWPEITNNAQRRNPNQKPLFKLIDEESEPGEERDTLEAIFAGVESYGSRSLSSNWGNYAEYSRSIDTSGIENIMGEIATPSAGPLQSLQKQNVALWEEVVHLRSANKDLQYRLFRSREEPLLSPSHASRHAVENVVRRAREESYKEAMESEEVMKKESTDRCAEKTDEACPVGVLSYDILDVACAQEECTIEVAASLPTSAALSPVAASPSSARSPSKVAATLPTLLGSQPTMTPPAANERDVLPKSPQGAAASGRREAAPQPWSPRLRLPGLEATAMAVESEATRDLRGAGRGIAVGGGGAHPSARRGEADLRPRGPLSARRREAEGCGPGTARRRDAEVARSPCASAPSSARSSASATSAPLSVWKGKQARVAAAQWSGPLEFLRAMRPADPAGLPRLNEM